MRGPRRRLRRCSRRARLPPEPRPRGRPRLRRRRRAAWFRKSLFGAPNGSRTARSFRICRSRPAIGWISREFDDALKTLFKTDLFADVQIQLQGTDLIVRVSENPIINQVVFEGNHELKEEKLRDEVQVRPRGVFTRSRAQADVQRIVELYRRSGRVSATVTPQIVELPQKRVDLIFVINEGPESGILNINVIGNKQFSDNDLRNVIVTKKSKWYKFFSNSDNYDPDRVDYDREQLRKFYRNRGFYDFHVLSAVAELDPSKNGFALTYTIDEGGRYKFGKLTVETDLKRLNAATLQKTLPLREGQTYQDDLIDKATDALTFAAGSAGFAFVDVRPRYTANPQTHTVDVNFQIVEGPRVYVERIDIVGNNRTIDPVIRREMLLSEGDAYNRVLVDRSKVKIKALGFFKDVDIEQLPGSAPDKTVLRVKITEQPTGELSFSLGYSSVEQLIADIGISERNFRGRGQQLTLKISAGYLEQGVDLRLHRAALPGPQSRGGLQPLLVTLQFLPVRILSVGLHRGLPDPGLPADGLFAPAAHLQPALG